MPTKIEPCLNCGVKHRFLTADQCSDRKMSERTLQDRVLYRARKYGWKTAHAGRGVVGFHADETPIVITPMSPGWPDLTLAKAGNHLLFFELKKEEGEVSPEQWGWLELLNYCGARAIVVRPSDLRLGRVNIILKEGDPLG